MPTVDVQLPAGIGERVQIRIGELAGNKMALVIGWRLTRPRFALGGSLDGIPQLTVQVLTDQGEERWVQAGDVAGVGGAVHVSVSLPFTGGDEVIVHPSRAVGEIRGWEIVGRRLETSVTYRVHLHRTPTGDVIEADSRDLEPRTRAPASGTA